MIPGNRAIMANTLRALAMQNMKDRTPEKQTECPKCKRLTGECCPHCNAKSFGE